MPPDEISVPDIPCEKRFAVLCRIHRESFFEWVRTVAGLHPEEDMEALITAYWEEVGRDTAESYLERLDPGSALAPQVARLIVVSSICMGEDARVLPGRSGSEAFVEHVRCPWEASHRSHGLGHLDRPGCDAWFGSTLNALNGPLQSDLRFETLASMPEGDERCLRRIWDGSTRGDRIER